MEAVEQSGLVLVYLGSGEGRDLPWRSVAFLRELRPSSLPFVLWGACADLEDTLCQALTGGPEQPSSPGGPARPFISPAAFDLSEPGSAVTRVVAFPACHLAEVRAFLASGLQATRLIPEDLDPQREEVLWELARLYDLTATLREECPWDRKQTQESIVTYTLEESYELADAVGSPEEGRNERVQGELGDLLFQVYFLARVAAQAGWYDLGGVAAGIRKKLVRRHPHIFAEVVAETSEDVRRNWDEIKRTTEGRQGIFHEIPSAFPGTLLAQKLQQRAATVGFDWAQAAEVIDKIREEVSEVEEALRSPGRGDEVASEVGDLAFAVVNLARKLKVDPELSLREASQRFRDRVEVAARLAAEDGRRFEELGLGEQEVYFQRAKRNLRKQG